ncbi:nuclear transport factor 2 family protein [Mangrovimicrobium sediminis]|uniref:Nuclear transport factor 2 family protein n=1 Tax=Mangrovimicrobium sediminis TaxID=2562682 RepID=A0A4Z0M7U2_9GAMM|nr:nuclear transport factor 2 family protein [Haliea sp. SAOS-164]TGD75733.1 nuclear transport factor 2 family protein [Haliea sp. SAOS-164]
MSDTNHAPGREARLAAMLDRQDILDCLGRISRAIDRFDRELFLSGYHEDAVVDAGSLVGAPGEVYDRGAELHEHGQTSTLHNLLNHYCELDGDSAHTETYFFYSGVNRDGSNWIGGGRYLDRLERRAGHWRVSFRYTLMEWSATLDGNAVPLFEQIPDLHANGTPCRTREDPSYRRPLVNRRAPRSPGDMRELSRPRGDDA